VIYMKVYKHWSSDGKMSFTSYLCTSIYRRLRQWNKIKNKRAKVWNTAGDHFDPQDPNPPPHPFDKDSFFEDLTADARVILQFIFEEPVELKTRVVEKGNRNHNWLFVIRAYLKEEGWIARRISESFEEIRSIL